MWGLAIQTALSVIVVATTDEFETFPGETRIIALILMGFSDDVHEFI